jgi:hypothetical protein
MTINLKSAFINIGRIKIKNTILFNKSIQKKKMTVKDIKRRANTSPPIYIQNNRTIFI